MRQYTKSDVRDLERKINDPLFQLYKNDRFALINLLKKRLTEKEELIKQDFMNCITDKIQNAVKYPFNQQIKDLNLICDYFFNDRLTISTSGLRMGIYNLGFSFIDVDCLVNLLLVKGLIDSRPSGFNRI